MGPYKFKKPRDVELSANVADKSFASFRVCATHFRFTPDSRHIVATHQPTRWANSALMHCGKNSVQQGEISRCDGSASAASRRLTLNALHAA